MTGKYEIVPAMIKEILKKKNDLNFFSMKSGIKIRAIKWILVMKAIPKSIPVHTANFFSVKYSSYSS